MYRENLVVLLELCANFFNSKSLGIALETMRNFVEWSITTRKMVYIFKLLTVGTHDSGMKWSKRKAKTKALKMDSKLVHGDGADILFRF